MVYRAFGRSSDFHAVLGFHEHQVLTRVEVNARYHKLMLVLHPDKRGDAAEAFVGKARCDEAAAAVTDAVVEARRMLQYQEVLGLSFS